MRFNDILSRHEDLRRNKYYHLILVKGESFEKCKENMLYFFNKYQLVKYSKINIVINESIPSHDEQFYNKLDEALKKNKEILSELIRELKDEGINTLNDIEKLPQGYMTKILHTATHFLDGFFGIDTYFYNLEEYSHWVSEKLLEQIKKGIKPCWLIFIEAEI
jgi:hypothetical protein